MEPIEYNDITIPEEVLEQLKEYGVLEKEVASQSLRFGVFVFATVVLLLLGLGAEYLPILSQIPNQTLIDTGWQVVTLVLGLIAARTFRPTKVSGKQVEEVFRAFNVK